MTFKIHQQDDGTFHVSVPYYQGVEMRLPEMGFGWVDGQPGYWSTEDEDIAWRLSERFSVPIHLVNQSVVAGNALGKLISVAERAHENRALILAARKELTVLLNSLTRCEEEAWQRSAKREG